MALVRAARRVWRPRGAGGGAAGSPDPELQRARAIMLFGLALWLVIAIALELFAGGIAPAVLVGWAGSGLLCVVFGVWPLGLAHRRSFAIEIVHDEDAAPAPPVVPHHAVEPTTDVINIRDLVLEPLLEQRVREVLDSTASQ